MVKLNFPPFFLNYKIKMKIKNEQEIPKKKKQRIGDGHDYVCVYIIKSRKHLIG